MRTNGRSHLILALGALGLAVVIVSCVSAPDDEVLPADAPPPPSLNHAAHIAKKMACETCHDPDDTGDMKLPPVSLCWDCHDEEDQSTWNAPFKAYFESIRQADGSYAFRKTAYSPDLLMNHPEHAGAEIACADCHGQPAETAYVRAPAMELKQRCMGCHEDRGASNDCATCHRETRSDVAPASHTDTFEATHGKMAPAGWKRGEGGLCALCHRVPDGCTECHTSSKPRSHGSAAFRRDHGTALLDVPFPDTKCALCHEEESCDRCHALEKPRNHTGPFERRLHGVAASVERQTCMVCHTQDFCERCHEVAKPVSHRGSWGSGRQLHCLGCHDPLQSTGCVTCHKNTLGHLEATPLPPGWPHETADDCSVCHPVIPHVDDGGNCRRCHRVTR